MGGDTHVDRQASGNRGAGRVTRSNECALLAFPGPGPYVNPGALAVEDGEKLDRAALGAAEPMRHPGVELGRLARLQRQVVRAQDKSEPPADHVQPLVAL